MILKLDYLGFLNYNLGFSKKILIINIIIIYLFTFLSSLLSYPQATYTPKADANYSGSLLLS
jgi:hypothetical protein